MSDKPIKTLRDGLITATLWKNHTDDGAFYSVNLIRSYKDQDGEWNETPSFSGSDLLKASNLATRAYDFITDLVQERKAKKAA